MSVLGLSPNKLLYSPHDTRSINDPPSNPIPTRIRLARLLQHHLRQSILATKPHTPTIHRKSLIEKLRRQRMAASRTSFKMVDKYTGGTAQDIEAPSPLHDLFDHFDDVGFLGDVASYESRCGLAVLVFDLLFDAGGA
jgi:hypothetical protein